MSRFFRDTPIRHRIIIALLLPLFGMLGFSTYLVVERASVSTEMASLEKSAILSTKISALIHELQKERGASALYLGSVGGKVSERLARQRITVDTRQAELERFLESFDTSALGRVFEDRLHQTRSSLLRLESQRRRISSRDTDAQTVVAYYTTTIAAFFDMIAEMHVFTGNTPMSNAISALLNFIEAKEGAGLERAIGSTGFAAAKFDRFLHRQFIELISEQKTHLRQFRRFATSGQKRFFALTMVGEPVQEVARMREIAINSVTTANTGDVTASHWFAMMSRKIDLMKRVEDKLSDDVRALAAKLRGAARTALFSLAAAAAVLTALTAVFARLLVLGITRPLASLTGLMTALSEGDMSVAITGVEFKDEIGGMSRAVEVFKDNAIKRKRAETALVKAKQNLEQRVEQRTADLRKANKALTKQIAERKRAEKTALQHETRLQGIMDHVVDGIITIDEQGHIQSINSSAQQIFGFSEEEIIGRNVKVLTPEPYHGEHDGYIQSYMRSGKGKILGVGPRDVIGRRKDGTTVPLALAISEMFVGDKRIFIGSLRDVTERHATEAQLRHVQKMEAMGQLTGGVAHDFNNLLSVILGQLQLLGRSLDQDEGLQERVDKAVQATLRGATLTKQLLAFSRRQVLEPRVLNLNELVSRSAELWHRTLGEEIEVKLQFADDLWLTEVDPGQLENALLNLVINAKQAMPEGGFFTLETANVRLDAEYASRHAEVTAGPYVMLAVTDTGVGMSPDTLNRAMEPFFTTKGVGIGTGLGLSMIYGFVKQSEGHINIYSEEGHGTTVKIYLPKATSSATKSIKEAKPVGEAMPSGDETILVVEDDAFVRETAVAFLKLLGYRVLEAEHGPAALAKLDKNPEVDLLFTDVVMPGGMTGATLAAKARERFPDIKVLFTSGYTENSIVNDGKLDVGAQLIGKPYLDTDLALKIRRVLDDPNT